MENSNKSFLEDKALPTLIELNQFVIDGLSKIKFINIPDIVRLKLIGTLDKSGTVISVPITFVRELDETGSVNWAGYYAGTRVSTDFIFSQAVQKGITKVLPALIGGPVTLGVRIGIFIGSTGLTFVMSEHTDEALRENLKWALDEGGDEIKEGFVQVQSYAYNGKLVEKLAATADKVADKIWQLTGKVKNILGEDVPLHKRELNIRLPLLEGRGQLEDLGMVEVEHYQRAGHSVRAHQRTMPDGDLGNNLSVR